MLIWLGYLVVGVSLAVILGVFSNNCVKRVDFYGRDFVKRMVLDECTFKRMAAEYLHDCSVCPGYPELRRLNYNVSE